MSGLYFLGTAPSIPWEVHQRVPFWRKEPLASSLVTHMHTNSDIRIKTHVTPAHTRCSTRIFEIFTQSVKVPRFWSCDLVTGVVELNLDSPQNNRSGSRCGLVLLFDRRPITDLDTFQLKRLLCCQQLDIRYGAIFRNEAGQR